MRYRRPRRRTFRVRRRTGYRGRRRSFRGSSQRVGIRM